MLFTFKAADRERERKRKKERKNERERGGERVSNFLKFGDFRMDYFSNMIASILNWRISHAGMA